MTTKQAERRVVVPDAVFRKGEGPRIRTIELRYVKASDIDPNPLNWRTHPIEQREALRGVLTEYGFAGALEAVEVDGRLRLLDGHLRHEELFATDVEIPVLVLDLDEREARLHLATKDPLAALAGASAERLDALLRDVSTGNAAVQALLASVSEGAGLTAFGESPAVEDPGAQIDRADELREKWRTERGQLWEIGGHRLLCGDSTDAGDVARLMGGERAEMMWADPPYGVEYVGKTANALTIANDGADGLLPLLVGAFGRAAGALVESAPFYIAHPAGPLSLTFGDAIRNAGWRLHQTLVWVKDSMVLGHSDYHYRHEPIYYGYLPGQGRAGRGNHEGSRWHGDNSQTTVLEFDRPKRNAEHPTMKPPELVSYCIGNSSASTDSVYDPFLGSGTTMVAAEQLGRRCYGMEIEPKYVAVALERMAGMGLSPRLVS